MTKEVIALVLAGGIGKRWWPLTTYKPLVSFLGKTVLELTLARLIHAGLSEAVVVTSPENQSVIKRISVPGIQTSVAIQKEANGMGGAILAAKERIKGRAVFIVNACDLVDEDYYDELKTAIAKGKAFITGIKRDEYFDTGYIQFDADRVKAIIEKPGKGNEPSTYASLVFDFFPEADALLGALENTSSGRDDVFEKALSTLLVKEEFGVVKYEGFWVPMKYPWHILDYMDYVLTSLPEHRGKNGTVKQNVIIEGPVWIGNNVKIFENTKIIGPSFIGDNTIIGNNNIIRHSHIGANCVTGFNTDITRSYIGDTCWFHSNFIGDSVLEGDISLGSGNVLANLRLDEGEIFSVVRGERLNTKRKKLGAIIGRHVRIGVNTSVMPGVKIGSHSMVGAGLMVDRDVPEGSFVAGGTPMVITKNTRVIQKNRDDFKKNLL